MNSKSLKLRASQALVGETKTGGIVAAIGIYARTILAVLPARTPSRNMANNRRAIPRLLGVCDRAFCQVAPGLVCGVVRRRS